MFQKFVRTICIVAGDIYLALLFNTQYFYIVDNDMWLNNNTHRMHCYVFLAKWLRQRATILLDAYIAYLVLENSLIISHVFKAVFDGMMFFFWGGGVAVSCDHVVFRNGRPAVSLRLEGDWIHSYGCWCDKGKKMCQLRMAVWGCLAWEVIGFSTASRD